MRKVRTMTTRTDLNLYRAARIAFLGLAALALANCATPRHRIDAASEYRPAAATSFVVAVRAGDTVSAIAERYRVNVEDIVAINNLTTPDRIAVGDQLYVPAYGIGGAPADAMTPASNYTASYPRSYSAPQTQTVASAPTASSAPVRQGSSSIERSDLPAPPTQAGAQVAYTPNDPISTPRAATLGRASNTATFLWPINGRLLSDFGAGANGERNDGINIAGARGTPFRAAAGGTVTSVGNELRGFGNLLLIRHDNGYVTAYAHADQIMVARGDRVEAGQIVGHLGATGDVTEPQLHFEIRQGTQPVDPTALLTLVPLRQASLTPRDPAKS